MRRCADRATRCIRPSSGTAPRPSASSCGGASPADWSGTRTRLSRSGIASTSRTPRRPDQVCARGFRARGGRRNPARRAPPGSAEGPPAGYGWMAKPVASNSAGWSERNRPDPAASAGHPRTVAACAAERGEGAVDAVQRAYEPQWHHAVEQARVVAEGLTTRSQLSDQDRVAGRGRSRAALSMLRRAGCDREAVSTSMWLIA